MIRIRFQNKAMWAKHLVDMGQVECHICADTEARTPSAAAEIECRIVKLWLRKMAFLDSSAVSLAKKGTWWFNQVGCSYLER